MEDLLIKIVYEQDPIPAVFHYCVEKFANLVDVRDIRSSYERLEEELLRFEEWLFEIWGKEMYKLLVRRNCEEWSIFKAFGLAKEMNANLLLCDGLSLRELLVLKKSLENKVSYSVGFAPHPTRTETVVRQVFNASTLEKVFSENIRLVQGYNWRMTIIRDINDPPRIGSKSGQALLTYYPDAPLHRAVEHGIKIQDVPRVIGDLVNLIKHLSSTRDLVVVGDHGYIFLGENPAKYLWRWIAKIPRHGGSYKEYGLEVEGESIAIGRFHAPDVKEIGSLITHGGASIVESLVPIIVVKGGIP